MAKSKEYNKDSIRQLQGLEPIRLRPGMYVGGSGKGGFHHILWEVIDNSVDEFLANHCTKIRVRIDTKRNVASVEDDGRGIPTETHAQTGEPTIVSIFTKLHMGGKFERGEAYALSGGLHGVGAKATCALSDRMTVWSFRGKRVYRADFSKGKTVKHGPDKKSKPRPHGTKVMFHPDPEIFRKIKFDVDLIRNRIRSTSHLCPGLTILLVIDGNKPEVFKSSEGLSGLLREHLGKEEPLFDEPLTFNLHDSETKEGIEVSMWWTDGDGEKWYTFVNMIDIEGGSYEPGAKSAITRELKKFCKADKVSGDDFRDGMRVACHIKLRDPQFEGQTKNKLNNPEMSSIAERVFGARLRNFLSKNPAITKKIITRATELAKARAAYKASRKIATQTAYAKDPSSRRGLPMKLTAALGCKAEDRELFIVEGGSAGGSAIRGRDGKCQEVLALRGKIPNVTPITDMVKLSKVFENEEIDAIIRSVGAGHDLEMPGESCDPEKARVGKVVLLTDADADGGHIDALLLGFMLRFMYPLVEKGMVWVARPPLFVAKWGNNRVYGDSREEVIGLAQKKGVKKPQVSRFKGLGEMNAAELAETSMSHKTRRLQQITADRSSIQKVIDLMGSDSTARKQLLLGDDA